MRTAFERFAIGVVLVRLPVVALVEARELPKRLTHAAAQGLAARAPHGHAGGRAGERGLGLQGNSMFVIKPPHGLADTLREVLPSLAATLAQFDGATQSLDSSQRS